MLAVDGLTQSWSGKSTALGDGGSYEAIPLEVNACTLGGRFEQTPAGHFSVAEEVRQCAEKGKL